MQHKISITTLIRRGTFQGACSTFETSKLFIDRFNQMRHCDTSNACMTNEGADQPLRCQKNEESLIPVKSDWFYRYWFHLWKHLFIYLLQLLICNMNQLLSLIQTNQRRMFHHCQCLTKEAALVHLSVMPKCKKL